MFALPPLHCWVVGDSTVSQFHDNYYVPRAGYGTALDQYLHATIHNLAHSGASSKSFTQLPEYQEFTRACHIAQDDTQSNHILIIGFGHNDEKTDPDRHTTPNASLSDTSSIGYSLVTHYIQPALASGMHVIVCTPIARLNSANNTYSGYMDEHGHITTAGNYAQAIRDLVDTMYRTDPSLTERLYCIDLTESSIALNIAWGNNAQWLHAFTGARYHDA